MSFKAGAMVQLQTFIRLHRFLQGGGVMKASVSVSALAIELDRCIDQLLINGTWEARVPPDAASGEFDSLMGVAVLLRALTRCVAPAQPGLKDRTWASISTAMGLQAMPGDAQFG